jgi:DNA polymerase V
MTFPTRVSAVYSLDASSAELIPLASALVPAGFPSPADDYTEEKLNLHDLLVTHPAATFFVRAVGTSMIDAGIQSGDLLVVNRALQPRDGAIVIAIVDGELTVKTYRDRGGQLRLVPENPAQPPIPIGPESEVHVWGVVTSVVHQFQR